jgi:hypothetical protein
VSDIDDFHVYATIPEHAAMFDDVIADLALRPLWTYSPHGDAQRRGDEPVVLSEFGSWGLPTLGDAVERRAEPAWFDVRPWGAGWDQEPGSPTGVVGRFHELGLGSIWADYDALAGATQQHQVAALRSQIEALRRQDSIAGYAVTQLTDTYWESNGILDFERRPKAPISAIAAFNRDDVLIANPDRRSFQSGGDAHIRIQASLFAGSVEAESALTWALEGEPPVSRPIAALASGTTNDLGSISIRLPEVDALSYVPIAISVVAGDGRTVASTTLTLPVVPTSGASSGAGPLTVVSDLASAANARTSDIEARLEAEGYRLARRHVPDTRLAVADVATRALLDWVRDGGSLLYLADRRNPFFWTQARGGPAEGWITSFSWIDAAVHARLVDVRNPLGTEFTDVFPQRTITGLPFARAAKGRDVLAGMVTGWVHHPSAHTLRFRFGRGRVVMTTFRLAATVGSDPIGTAMFHDLIDHLASDQCRPTLAADGGWAQGDGRRSVPSRPGAVTKTGVVSP